MAFTGLTPEALLGRSDSKNPATTCKGLTKAGRPCRNPLSIDPAKAARYNGVLAVVSVASDSDEEEIEAAAFFCHRHKDQAEQLVAASQKAAIPQRQNTRIYSLQHRSSIDTLVARLGVLEVDDTPQRQRQERKTRDNRQPENRPPRRVHRPPTWDRVQGPLMEVPSELVQQRPSQDRPQRKKPGIWQLLCCGAATDDDYVEVPARPVNQKIPSETEAFLSYIPKSLPPQTTSALLTELAKPISQSDDEGYIYIFWLTPEAAGPAPSSTASSLLAPPARPEQGRRTSDVLRQYSVRKPQRPNPNRPRRRSAVSIVEEEKEKETILLKIGRANNVHRRMNEWTRQCGYSLSLVRFYPYVPSTPSPSPQPSPRGSPAQSRRPSSQNATLSQRPNENMRRASSGVRKVPHAHRVERLIHLELAEQRVMKKCDACGKDHREWFEVDASKEGVKAVDEVVRRWVDWAERANN
ncbi:DUF1766-domain-containing protein [Lophiostoma macrostomum CBS 122681]|uniref:DUF1766-domain-containing protein n=1 Tax=Lophiostoma macrostomum CBS 122681 TaxID=1314788 RepID=A0A6A6TD58_9PLEO|nr:DUF1766-domain-containing protein [Lophiostoma macrostomum CBS 122681]